MEIVTIIHIIHPIITPLHNGRTFISELPADLSLNPPTSNPFQKIESPKPVIIQIFFNFVHLFQDTPHPSYGIKETSQPALNDAGLYARRQDTGKQIIKSLTDEDILQLA